MTFKMDGITQTDVKSLFSSYSGHLNFYKDDIQDGYLNFCTQVLALQKKGVTKWLPRMV